MQVARLQWISILVVVAAVWAAPASADEAPLAVDQLVYAEAPVQFQVDVNGEAAVQIIGGVLDAAAEVAQEQLASLKQMQGQAPSGPRRGMSMPAFLMTAAPPLIEPAKETVKSITQVTLLAMEVGESARLAEIHGYYNALMTQRGWMPLATVRAQSDEGLLLLLAPGGKGLFGVLRPNKHQLIVGMITTTKPLGDLIGQIVRAGGGQILPMFFHHRVARKEAAKAAAAPSAPKPAPEE